MLNFSCLRATLYLGPCESLNFSCIQLFLSLLLERIFLTLFNIPASVFCQKWELRKFSQRPLLGEKGKGRGEGGGGKKKKENTTEVDALLSAAQRSFLFHIGKNTMNALC